MHTHKLPARFAFPLYSGPVRSVVHLHRGATYASSAPQASSNTATTLESWVRSGGGAVNGVAVRHWMGADGGSGYGLQAAQACTTGTQLVTLAGRQQLSFGRDSDPRLLALISRVPNELWGAKLALQLIAHRLAGGSGAFAPYIAALPQGFQGLPIFFPPEAVRALEYPPVTSQVARRCKWLLDFASNVIEPLRGTPDDPFNGTIVDANALGWALGAASSRAFRVRGPTQPAAFLPLIDMANHSLDPNAKITTAVGPSASSGGLSMIALRDIAPGEPILINYGNLSNDFLLLDYGFILPDNPYEAIQLRFDRGFVEAAKVVANVGSPGNSSDDGPLQPLPAWKLRALRVLGLAGGFENQDPKGVEVSITPVGAPNNAAGPGCPVDSKFLAGIRVLCAGSSDELERRNTLEELGRWGEPLSARNEVAVLRVLSGACAIALSQFSTSAEEDLGVLRQGVAASSGCTTLSDDVQLAIRFRIEKKRLLAGAISALSARMKAIAEGSVHLGKETSDREKSKSSKGFGR